MTGVAARLSEAAAHQKAGRFEAAEACYREVLDLEPGRASVAHNLGVLVAARGNHAEALALFDRAAASEPGYASAHYNRGVALDALGRTREAVAAFSRAVSLGPDHYAAHRALGFLWLGLGDRGRSLDHFARTYELRRGEDRIGLAVRTLDRASKHKLAHDAAQFRHLAKKRRDAQRFEMLARLYERVADHAPEGAFTLKPDDVEMLGDDYNTAINIWSAPEVRDCAISPSLDAADIEARYCGDGEVAVIDDLLSPAAWSSMRRFLLDSTIWHDFDHIGGFVASYLEDGLACPLVLQIADELRARFPSVLGPHPLSQAWAFKGLEATASVAAHADDAAVSVNLWMTPSEASTVPGSGGLLVCRTPPPDAWSMTGYDADVAEVDAFIAANAAACVNVSYAGNRAVLFNSRLFHRSNAPVFDTAYESRRINLTLLFGRHA